MTKHLSHEEWIRQQFQKYLRKSHRDCFIHSALIEGMLIQKSGKDKFKAANKYLLNSGKISLPEFNLFNEIREIRNSLAHEIIKNTFSQDDMDNLLGNLIDKIRTAYKQSEFLDNELIVKYNIKRPSIILFEKNK